MSDQFLQIATYLDSPKLYGLGEHERQHFPHDMNWDKWGMWTRDQAVTVRNRLLICCEHSAVALVEALEILKHCRVTLYQKLTLTFAGE